jgi:hypothetical protein
MDASGQGRESSSLEAAFAAAGVPGRVEAHGRLAVFVPRSSLPLDGPTRRRLVALARDHGFTNLAVEVTEPDADLSRD